MKAKLLSSAAVIGLVAISPAIAETVTIPVVSSSLDSADSSTGDGGKGGDANATANGPSARQTPLSRRGAPAEAVSPTAAMAAPRTHPRRLRRQTAWETAQARRPRRAAWAVPGTSAATAAARAHPPPRQHPARPGMSPPRRPRQVAPAAVEIPEEMAAARRRLRRRSGAAAQSMGRPALWAATAA
jgi:hypothetical protein